MRFAGAADPQLGSWPEGVESPTVIQTMPLWPSVWADAAFTVSRAEEIQQCVYLHDKVRPRVMLPVAFCFTLQRPFLHMTAAD